MAASAMAMFNKANNLAFSSSVLPCAAAIICAILFQWPGGVSVPAPSAQNNAIWVWSCVRVEPTAAPSSLYLVVVRRVLLAIEGGRARRTELRAAAHAKWHNKSPLGQQIGKKCRRSRHPHTWTAAARWLDYGIGTIVGARGEDLVRDKFTPHDAGGLLWPIGDSSENRGMKCIEGGCSGGKQIDERPVRRGAGSSFTRRTCRRFALHQVRLVRAGNAVNRVVD